MSQQSSLTVSPCPPTKGPMHRMHIHFEKSTNAETDCTILSMSWMGKVPEEVPEEDGWKLNRNHYYQEGWLATGNVRGILGVTYTTSFFKRAPGEMPIRKNYNLRGHRSQSTLVAWNEPYQKLASCDSSGIIFVWIKFEGRWSIELINDRSTPVTHFSWSHDGRMALICYQDGFVLVGSVAGQRYWSTGLNLDGTITCGIWTPDDQQVFFGTSNGQIVVMDVHGTMLSQVQLPSDSPIASMAWSCEKFKMEESEDGEPTHSSPNKPFILAICFTTGGIYLMKNYDDIAPIYIFTGMHGLHMEWSNSGEYLAIAGSRPVEVVNESGVKVKEYTNHLHIYSPHGIKILNLIVPNVQSPVTALTWGHNDKRVFVATGKKIHVGWVSKRIASLQLLCRLTIYKSLSTETCVSHLPLPLPVRALISSLHTQTVLSNLPNPRDMREFVSHPPIGVRLYCTMIRHTEEVNQSPGTVYTLYVEYLGGLVPILKGKRASKIRPEFVIFDPQHSEGGIGMVNVLVDPGSSSNSSVNNISLRDNGSGETYERSSPSMTMNNPGMSNPGYTDSSESEEVELCASPRMQRKRYRNRQRERERMLIREREREWDRTRSSFHLMPEPTSGKELVYADVLPESVRLVEVKSNIWGTKFSIQGLASSVPSNLGSVTYKTSLLHLQPRQMTLMITELRDDIFLSQDGHADEEDEDFSMIVGHDSRGQNPGAYIPTDGIYNGHHVIFHPQGAGSSLYPHSRCFLEPRTPSQNENQQEEERLRSENDENSNSNPNDSSIPTQNESCVSGNQTKGKSGNPSFPLVNNPCEAESEEDGEKDEFPYVDLTANPDMLRLREKLRQTMHSDSENRSGSSLSQPSTSGTSALQQMPAVQATPIRRRSVDTAETSRSFVTRAHIENIEENSPSHSNHAQPLRRHQQGSVKSPTRNCWGDVSESQTSSTGNPSGGGNTRSIVPTISPRASPAPIHVRRSMSASFLDSVDRQGALSLDLDLVDNESLPNSPPKRLILVKKSPDGGKLVAATPKPRLKDCGKSKSWDSSDINWWRNNYSYKSLKESTNCPNCSFPTALKKFTPTKASTSLNSQTKKTSVSGNKCNNVPDTPAHSNANPYPNYNTISTSTPRRSVPQTPMRRARALSQSRTPAEDRIECVPLPPPASSSSSSNPTPGTPVHTPNTHRRSLSLLTPLLRRREREMNNRQNQSRQSEKRGSASSSGSGGNPASSSFIPPASPQHQPRSSPTTPASQRKNYRERSRSYLASASSPFRQLFANSPLLSRRKNKNNNSSNSRTVIDSSDDEGSHPEDGGQFRPAPSAATQSPVHSYSHSPRNSVASGNCPFKDLETFQKQQLRQKLRNKKIHNSENPPIPRRREFLMHNKAPMWNENSQVYQLDFGGRVTQESAKNFQIEFKGKQVMQFGRIEQEMYTLDFQYPFSAIQAFAVALANVTQRLK